MLHTTLGVVGEMVKSKKHVDVAAAPLVKICMVEHLYTMNYQVDPT